MRRPLTTPALLVWREEREEKMQSAMRWNLGLRPEGWWEHEAGRPDLAYHAGRDRYAELVPLFDQRGHADLDEPQMVASAERFRYLAEHGDLTAEEVRTIYAGTEFRHQWRRDYLLDMGIYPTPNAPIHEDG